MSEDIDINDIIAEVEKEGNQQLTQTQTQNVENFQEDLIISALTDIIDQILYIASNLTKLESLKLTNEDKTQLYNALKPFAPDLLGYSSLFKYLPICVFSIGLAMRVMAEIQQKRKVKPIENLGNLESRIIKSEDKENKEKSYDITD